MEQTDKLLAFQTTQSSCDCWVCKILLKGFSSYDFQEKKNIISSGRHTPAIHLETRVEHANKKFTRHFKIDFYVKYKWLTGCSTLAKLFCWPCLLFNTSEKNSWNWSGVTDLNNFHKNVKLHINGRGHLTALIKEKTFGKTRIERNFDNEVKLHNELVTKNRDILKRLIDITCFLGEHDLSFGWPLEDRESTNHRNYVALTELLAKYDEPLKTHLKDSTAFQGTSDRIQNDLMKCVADVVLESIKKEIKETQFVSIVLDETTDITNVSKLAVVVRYVKLNGTIQERFLRFLDQATDRTDEAIFKIVCDIVEELECSSKLVAQSYGGAIVPTGHLESLRDKVQQKFQNVVYVQCYAHRLNLILSQALGHDIKDCKVFFSTLSGIAAFFKNSPERTRALDIQVRKRFPKANLQWIRLVQTVSQYRMAFVDLFENILDNKEQWDSETVNSSRGYLHLLENDFDFNFLLNLFSELFPHMDLLYDILQTKSNDIEFCVQHISTIDKKLNLKKFQYFWEKSMNLHLEPHRKIIKMEYEGSREAWYNQLYLEIVDHISEQVRVRFQYLHYLKFVELCNFRNYNSHFPEEALDLLNFNFENVFDTVALRSQLNVLYDTPEVNNQETPLNMLLFLQGTGLEESYSEVFKLCHLVLTIPSTSASVELGFPTLKRIKNFVASSMGKEKLTDLAMISIEKECIKELSKNPRFYEDVINRFANVDGRITLHYK